MDAATTDTTPSAPIATDLEATTNTGSDLFGDMKTGDPGQRGKLQGRPRAGGKLSREKFSHLIGLGDPNDESAVYRVAAVGWQGVQLEIEVAWGDEGELVVFVIEHGQDGKPAFMKIGALAFYYRGDGLPEPLEDIILNARLPELEGMSIEDLGGIIANDPDVIKGEDRIPICNIEGEDEFQRRNFLSSWGQIDVWYQFFAQGEISRAKLDSLDIFERCTFLQHCDQECLQLEPHFGVQLLPIVNYPWLDRFRDIPADRAERIHARTPKAPSTEDSGPTTDGPKQGTGGMFCTDFDDHDTIMGSNSKFEEVLEAALQQETEFICVSCTCVPYVAGEDVESITDRLGEQYPDTEVLYLTQTPESSVGIFRDVLVHKRLEAEKATFISNDRMVNLVGFPQDRASEEHIAMLEACDVEVNQLFIPAMDIEKVYALPKAKTHIFMQNSEWQFMYDQLLFDTKIASVYPPAPFGVKQTRQWLKESIDAVGGSEKFEAVWDSHYLPMKDEFEALRQEALDNDYRMGIVAGDNDIHKLTDPANLWAIPMLAMLEEMGFGVEIMFLARNKDHAADYAKQALAMFEHPERHGVAAFHNQERMEMLLQRDHFQAVFSEHFADFRLTQAGKAQYSGQYFERGLQGIVRTQQRLLELCRMPFYRRYAKYLRRPDVPGLDKKSLEHFYIGERPQHQGCG
jgi:hypothetical protein